MTSLRYRLLGWLLGLLTLVGALAGVVAYVSNRQEMDASLDAELRQIALNVGGIDFPVAARSGDGVAIDREDEFVVTVWDGMKPLHSSDPSLHPARPGEAGYSTFETAGEAWRAYARIVGKETIQVAQRMVVRDEFAANSAARAVLPIAALIPLSWLLVGWVVGRVLRPLRGVTEQLRRWGKDQSSPLALADVPDEILPLALATNDLVTRQQAQLEFRERFISDAAHELRTPLAALRLQAGNLAASLTSPEQEALLGDVLAGLRRMADLVTKLLELARADSAGRVREPVVVDLSGAVAAALQDVMPLAAEKDIDIGVVGGNRELVLADPAELRTLIGNLADNAVRYTPKGGVVDIAVTRTANKVVLEIRDSGPGIPEERIEQVFGRFVRLPGGEGEGSGLGLAIVKAIAEHWGAHISLNNRHDPCGLVARVSFEPVEPPDRPSRRTHASAVAAGA
jgi:two-component system OmpR family sensor kinase